MRRECRGRFSCHRGLSDPDMHHGMCVAHVPWCMPGSLTHDDVIKWKHFPRYWLFVRGIHRPTVNFPSQRPVTRSFDVFFDMCLNKQLSKQTWGWGFKKPSRSLWRHRNVAVSFDVGGGEIVPGIPGTCATRNFTYLVKGSYIPYLESVVPEALSRARTSN